HEFAADCYNCKNAQPHYPPMHAYQPVTTPVPALNNAKSLDPAKVRDALRNINLKSTAFGPVKFDANGQNQHVVLITQVQGGTYHLVYPPNIADAKPIIPATEWSKR